jgi:hypothetical protein
MIIRYAVCCAFLLTFTTAAWSAANAATEKATAPRKPLRNAAVRKAYNPTVRAQKTIHKTSMAGNFASAHAPRPAAQGTTEILTCRNGTEDRHARIGVVLVGGKADSFAYYSKWKPRTCSIHLQRQRDSYSQWTDNGNVTNVSMQHGLFLIEHGKGEYRFVFRDIDRQRFCGMAGTINGTLTLRKGSEHCELTGIMEEGVPLGQANAHLEQPAARAAAPQSAPEAAPAKQASPPSRSPPQSVFPSSASE